MTITRNWDIMYEAMISEGSTPVIHDRSSRPCAELAMDLNGYEVLIFQDKPRLILSTSTYCI